MNVGLNVGYSHTKAVGGSGGDIRTTRFPSVVGSPDLAHWTPGIEKDRAQGIRLQEPERVLVGDEAITQSRFLHRREDRAWVESEEWWLLSLAALSELTKASTTIKVVTGLPVAYYSDKSKVERGLTGIQRFQRVGRNAQNVTIEKVTVIPEPYGTLFDQLWTDTGATKDAEIATGRFGIIDAGGKTTNLLSVDRMQEIGRHTTSIPVGVWDAVRAMRTHLEEVCQGLELRDHQIVDAMIRSRVQYKGEAIDISHTTARILKSLVSQIVNQVYQLWSGTSLDGILITGGGAALFGTDLESGIDLAPVRAVTDPVMANARGFWKYAQYLDGRR